MNKLLWIGVISLLCASTCYAQNETATNDTSTVTPDVEVTSLGPDDDTTDNSTATTPAASTKAPESTKAPTSTEAPETTEAPQSTTEKSGTDAPQSTTAKSGTDATDAPEGTSTEESGPTPSSTPPPKDVNVAAIVIPILVIFALAGVGGFVYYRRHRTKNYQQF